MSTPDPSSPASPDAPTPETGESTVEAATSRLRSVGLRVTQPRVAILGALARQTGPVSIDVLHAAVGSAHCDLVTVYRCMAAFDEIGVVRRSFFHNGTALYELSLGQPARYHVICRASKRVERLDADIEADLRHAVEAAQEKLRARGYADVTHVVEFFALAPGSSPTPPPAAP